jgi:hypothetical protein
LRSIRCVPSVAFHPLRSIRWFHPLINHLSVGSISSACSCV